MVQTDLTSCQAGPGIVALVGPTGTGKTALALTLAERLGAEIVNADSRQVYRGLDIGSAKPSDAERSLVPHHLFDIVDPDEPFDCARYRDLAHEAIGEIRSRGRRVLLVGGTGLYLKVLRHGLLSGPGRDPELRARLYGMEEAASGTLHERLLGVDPTTAARLHPHDHVRLIRALEVFELTGTPLSVWQQRHAFRDTEVDVRMIGLTMERSQLYERINERCRAMVEGGLVHEVQGLLRCGYQPDLPSLRSIGYREIASFLAGRQGLSDAVDAMAQATRHLAKRQITWFGRDPTISWYDATRIDADDLARALAA